ncbi:proline-rich protein 36-like [Ischnura elegans]|uniref:proline-rich protein 36-like n=1 Tax=Ischnura elegans TaxID=197161 RepID=UPI001ED8B3F7|nr:proline-rich protein 36-like [Ischnura elegans]
MKLMHDIPVTVEVHRTLNTCRGVISHFDLLYVDADEIKQEMASQGVCDARRMTTKRNGEIVNTTSVVLTFTCDRLPDKVFIGNTQRQRLDVNIPNQDSAQPRSADLRAFFASQTEAAKALPPPPPEFTPAVGKKRVRSNTPPMERPVSPPPQQPSIETANPIAAIAPIDDDMEEDATEDTEEVANNRDSQSKIPPIFITDTTKWQPKWRLIKSACKFLPVASLGSPHHHSACTKPKDQPGKYANCAGANISTYRGCPQYKELALAMRLKNTPTEETPAAPANTEINFPPPPTANAWTQRRTTNRPATTPPTVPQALTAPSAATMPSAPSTSSPTANLPRRNPQPPQNNQPPSA